MNNTAKENGGGIFLYQSEINSQTVLGTLIVVSNVAFSSSGRIHAIGSFIKLDENYDKVDSDTHYGPTVYITETKQRKEVESVWRHI